MWDTERRRHLQAKERDPRGNQPYWHLDLRLPATGLWGNTFLLFESPALWSLYGSPSRLMPPSALWIQKVFFLLFHGSGSIRQWSVHLNYLFKKCDVEAPSPRCWVFSQKNEFCSIRVKTLWLRLINPLLQLWTRHWYLMLANSKNW